MADDPANMRRYMRRICRREESSYYAELDLARAFKIPALTFKNLAPSESLSGILLLPAEILDAIHRALDDSPDRILLALTCKTFASIYIHSSLSEQSQLKVVAVPDGSIQTRYEANGLVCRLSKIWSLDLRFCPRCRLFRTCELAFWNQVREYIKSVLKEESALTFGEEKKLISLKTSKSDLAWSEVPAELRDKGELERRILWLSGRILEWWGSNRDLDPPCVEIVPNDQQRRYWMDCPAHVFDQVRESCEG